MYGDVVNDMHLKASALILHQANRTSYSGALFIIYNKFNEPNFGPVAVAKVAKAKINSVFFGFFLAYSYLRSRIHYYNGQNEDERHAAQECGAAVETD